jgi:hypothetical protein
MTKNTHNGKKSIILADHANPSAGRGSAKSKKEFEADTERLTSLCQKQVNYWYTVSVHFKRPYSDDAIESIKKIAKITLLQRNTKAGNFVEALNRGCIFIV